MASTACAPASSLPPSCDSAPPRPVRHGCSVRSRGCWAASACCRFEPPADQRYAELRTALERAGTVIGANDMLIAAHALALGCTIVTDDVADFSRVRGCGSRNWLQ